MKRIILSVLAIAMAIGVTTTAAFALFSSTATVSGVTFSTGNANLQVWNGSAWNNDYNLGNFLFQNMYPSYATFQTFSLKNNSTSDIKLTLNAKLRDGAMQSPSDSWEVLKNKVEVMFSDSTGTPLTGWATLNYWNTTGHNFDIGLAKGENRWYRIEVRVIDGAGNEISEKHLTNMKFDFLGTQE